ncbi:MAG: hypothetical protein M1820_004707 [Bogoriella megaspora]|nr:MAG: hypothetical protein M1820_004707 [Bogoriella megaspora]
MDDFAELELMAANASTCIEDVSAEDIHRWQILFTYTHAKAESAIQEYRENVARVRVSDDHWAMVGSEMATLGHDKESYEYSLQFQHKNLNKETPERSTADSEYLLKLEEPLATPFDVYKAANLEQIPKILPGTDDSDTDASFVIINGVAKDAIASKFTSPTFIRLSKASKALSPYSAYPTLGFDTTLPHHRPSNTTTPFFPHQDSYPVWYFFYGTLAEPDRLMRLLNLPGAPSLHRASVQGGVLKTWAGTYRALVDARERSAVEGWAYLVSEREHEEALRYYETEKYEVVRCEIRVEGEEGVKKGSTFRFVDDRLLS